MRPTEMKMFERLQELDKKYEELSARLSDPEVWTDQKEYQRIAKACSELEEIVTKYREYTRVQAERVGTEEMLHSRLDDEMRELVLVELEDLKKREQQLEQELKILLLPKDKNDDKNVFIEIRAGAGGEEAALFAGDLVRMYTRFAERKGWKTELMSANETGIGGFKEAILSIAGHGAYSQLKFEGGVHRVQRVPETESSGRIHTSTATVAVLPEADEIEVQIDPDDLEIDTFRSSSAGGQNVQKNETAIRILHKPTGIVVACQDERSQLQNKERAMRMLRAHLLERMENEQRKQISETRRSMVGTGERSEKVRTYNFPQGRVTDHRVGLTLYRIESFMDGDIQEIIDHLIAADQAARLESQAECT